MKEHLTVPEAAALLKVSRRSLYYLLQEGRLQGRKKHGGRHISIKNILELLFLCKMPGVHWENAGNCGSIEDMKEVLRQLIDDQERLLLLSDVAKILNISYSTALDWFHEKKLAGVRFGNMIRIFESSIVRLLEENSNQGPDM